MPTFGEYFKELRLALRMTLRQFCTENGFDAGNISKIERGIFTAPQAQETLQKYARALRLREGSDQWIKFFDLAAVSNKMLPPLRNEVLIQNLPLFLRAIDNEDLDQEKLNKIVELIKSS